MQSGNTNLIVNPPGNSSSNNTSNSTSASLLAVKKQKIKILWWQNSRQGFGGLRSIYFISQIHIKHLDMTNDIITQWTWNLRNRVLGLGTLSSNSCTFLHILSVHEYICKYMELFFKFWNIITMICTIFLQLEFFQHYILFFSNFLNVCIWIYLNLSILLLMDI